MSKGGSNQGVADDENGDKSDDRRLGVRHFACFPVHIDDGVTRKRTAVIRDLSVTGTLLLTRAVLQVGDSVSLSLYISPDTDHPVLATGRIVRFENRGRDFTSIWPNSLAVQFDEPLAEHEAAIKAVAEHQAAMGLRPVE